MDLGNGVRRTTSSEELLVSMAFIFSVLHELKQNFYYNLVVDVANTAQFLGHLSHPGGLLLWVGVCVVCRPEIYWANLYQIWYVASVG